MRPQVPRPMPALKAGTMDLHRRVESAAPMAALNAGTVTHAAYMRALALLYGFYRPLEGVLAPHLAALGVAPKHPALAADLATLGVADVAALPLCAVLPRADGAAAAVGCAYVLEGPTLGGRVILRSLPDRLEAPPAVGGYAFYGFYDDAEAAWRRFGRALATRLDWDDAAEAEAVTAARETFAALLDWVEAN